MMYDDSALDSRTVRGDRSTNILVQELFPVCPFRPVPASSARLLRGRQVGWDAVRSSFEKVSELASDGTVELESQLIRVIGDMAYEAGVGRGHFRLATEPVAIEHRVTNIYRREGGAWKMIHHHADTSPEMTDVLGRLQQRARKTG